MNNMDIFLVCFFVGLVVLAWVTGQTVDIEPVDAQVCFKVCTVEPGKKPAWVKPGVFDNYSLQFYDWSQLDSIEWHRLKGAIHDYYNLLKEYNWVAKKHASTDSVDDQILSLVVGQKMEREACIRVLLLMVYHPEIYNKFNRYEAYNQKVESLLKM